MLPPRPARGVKNVDVGVVGMYWGGNQYREVLPGTPSKIKPVTVSASSVSSNCDQAISLLCCDRIIPPITRTISNACALYNRVQKGVVLWCLRRSLDPTPSVSLQSRHKPVVLLEVCEKWCGPLLNRRAPGPHWGSLQCWLC